MPRTSDTRARFLDTGARLFRRQGYLGTGLKQVAQESGAPIGSLYHFFPGGKRQLGIEAIERSGARYERMIDDVFEHSASTSSAAMVWFDMAADALMDSDFGDGCPIATVALEAAATEPELRAACAEMFASWERKVRHRLRSEGHGPQRAAQLASFAVSSLEGAIVLSRTTRSVDALRATGKVVAEVLESTPP